MDALVSGDVFLFGPFRLDRGGGGLFGADGHVVALGSRALDLLEFLIDHQGQLCLETANHGCGLVRSDGR